MCHACWDEYDSPQTEITKEIQTLLKLIDSWYKDYPVGGGLHIVLDDWNVETENIQWCLDNKEKYDWDIRGDRIVELMLPLTEEQRIAVLAYRNGYWK